jgi:hypothetical protein
MMTYEQFLVAFPEFSATAVYPRSQVEFWLDDAYSCLDATRLLGRTDMCAMLYTAHFLTIGALAARAASGGIVNSFSASGPTSSKSVGSASVSYASQAMTMKNGGPWNATLYGQRFYAMLRAASAGGLYFPATSRPKVVPGQ